MAARNGKRADYFRELRLKIAVEHPGWSDERARAEVIRAQLGQGDYVKEARMRIRLRGR